MGTTKELIGVFTVETQYIESTENTRYIVKGGDGKQVGSTFDDALGERLLSFASGVQLAVTVDKSGKFWNVIDVRQAVAPEAVVVAPPAVAAPVATAPVATAPVATAPVATAPVAAAPAQTVVAPVTVPGGGTAPAVVDVATGEIEGAFGSTQFTYFLGYSARVVSALIAADPAYAAKLTATNDVAKAAHDEVVRNAHAMFVMANGLFR